MIRRLFGFKLLGFLIGIFAWMGAATAEPTASEVVERFQATLIEVMKEAETHSVQQRFDRLAPSVDKSFHMPLMAQIASGNHWKDATTNERLRLISAFRRMSIATLATLFDGYADEAFVLVDEKPGPQKTLLVMTKLVKSDKSTIDIAYVTRRFKEGPRIIDVILDNGISELKVRRSEYRLILQNERIPGLIALLNGKADELIAK